MLTRCTMSNQTERTHCRQLAMNQRKDLLNNGAVFHCSIDRSVRMFLDQSRRIGRCNNDGNDSTVREDVWRNSKSSHKKGKTRKPRDNGLKWRRKKWPNGVGVQPSFAMEITPFANNCYNKTFRQSNGNGSPIRRILFFNWQIATYRIALIHCTGAFLEPTVARQFAAHHLPSQEGEHVEMGQMPSILAFSERRRRAVLPLIKLMKVKKKPF